MKFFWRCLLLFIVQMQMTLPLFAEQNAEGIEHIEIIHRGENTNLNTLIISRDELEQSYTQLSEVLSSLQGVQIRRDSALGSRTQVSIRGSNSQQVNLYIDGQLVNSGQFGSFDIDQLPIALIESVEVNQSQSSGTAATPIGGEIRITTIRPNSDKTTASISLGSFGYFESNIKHSINFQKQQLLASVHYLTSDNNYKPLIESPLYHHNQSEHQVLNNNQFEKYTAFVNHDWQHNFGESSTSLQYNQQSKHIPNYQSNTPENNSSLENDKFQISNQQTVSLPWKTMKKLHLSISFSQLDETYHHLPNFNENDLYQYQTRQTYFNVRLPVQFQNIQWQPFINYDLQRFVSDSLINQAPPACNDIGACDVETERNNINVGHKLMWTSANSNLNVYWTASNTFSDNKNTTLYPTTPITTLSKKQFFSQELNLQTQWKNHKLSAQLTKGARQPNMYELFGNRGLFKGNSNLEAERSGGVSISSLHRWVALTFEPTLYHQHVSNAIVAIYSSSGAGSYQNVSSVDLNGLSASIKWQINKQWQMGSSVDWIDSNTHAPVFSAFNNKHQPGIYHKELDIYLHWKPTPNSWIKLNHYIGTELYYDRANIVTSSNGISSEQHVSNISVNYQFEHFILNGRISNLFNNSFKDLSNRPAQGRQIQLTFTFKEF